MSLGEIAHQQGNLVDAQRRYQEALDLIGNDVQHPYYLVLLERLAEFQFKQGNVAQAARLQRKSLEMREQRGETAEVIGALRNLGLCERALGNFNQAIVCFERCYELARERQDILSVISGLDEKGLTQAAQGNHGSAVDTFREALSLQESHGISAAGTVAQVGLAHSLLEVGARPRKRCDILILLLEALTTSHLCKNSLTVLHVTYCSLDATGDVDRLIIALREMAERCAATGLLAREANSYLQLGRIDHFRLSQLDDAIKSYDRAIELLHRSDHWRERSQVLYYRALAKATLGDYECGYNDLRIWVKEFETVQAELSGLAFQQQQLADNLDRYTLLAVVCVHLGRIGEALEYIEGSRSQTLISFVSSRKVQPNQSVPSDLYERFLRVQADRQRLDLLLIQEHAMPQPSSSVNDMGQRLTALSLEWKQTLGEIAKIDPLFEQAFEARRIQYSDIVHLIPADRRTALIEFFVADGPHKKQMSSSVKSVTHGTTDRAVGNKCLSRH